MACEYVVFDLETTGYAPESCEIIEIGAFKVDRNRVIQSKFSSLIKPAGYIPLEVQRLTGITMEGIHNAETIEKVLPEFLDFCGDSVIMAHNLLFDYGFIKHHADKLGFDFTMDGERQGFDTLKMARKVLNLQTNKLGKVVEYFNITIGGTQEQYHRALYDALMCKLVYDRFITMYDNIDIVSTPELLEPHGNKKYGKVVNNETLSFI